MQTLLITPPAAEPVDMAVVEEHLRASTSGSDATLIESYLQSAREAVEAHTGRALMPQTWELRLPAFPSSGAPIEIPMPPLASVTSVTYDDADGAEVVMAEEDYQVILSSGPRPLPGRLLPAPGGTWPATESGNAAAVRIRFVCGYASASEVPAALRAAILLMLGDLYANREAGSERPISENPAVDRLLAPFRVTWL